MTHGTLSIDGSAIPIFSPPYPNTTHRFTDISVVAISYRVTRASVQALVPSELELEEEPVVTSLFLDYGMSHVGSYKEFVQTVRVSYRGEEYDYSLVLVLDNESAIFAGREAYGYPKVFGRTVIRQATGSRVVVGHVERPLGGKEVVSFEFVPEHLSEGLPKSTTRSLNLRVIPSPVAGSPPAVKEFVPVTMELEARKDGGGGSVWLGKGHIAFPKGGSAVDPWTNVDIVRYEGAFFASGVSAVLRNPTETIPL